MAAAHAAPTTSFTTPIRQRATGLVRRWTAVPSSSSEPMAPVPMMSATIGTSVVSPSASSMPIVQRTAWESLDASPLSR